MKTILIIPYFGMLPKWFDLWLLSCEYNKNFEWLIITNDKTKYTLPSNVEIIYMELEDLKEMFEDKLKMKISLEKPYKVCDFRPAFGFLFEDYIKDYDYWGYTDLDVIYGDIDNFINLDELKEYKKILNRGHFSLYLNEEKINQLFRYEYGNISFKKVFTSPESYIFDEWNGIYKIFKANGITQYHKEIIADINPNVVRFETTYGINRKKQAFIWDKGKIYRIYDDNGVIKRQEYAYIHFQKRKFKDFLSLKELNGSLKFLIGPSGFKIIDNQIDIFSYNNPHLKDELSLRVKLYKRKLLNLFN